MAQMSGKGALLEQQYQNIFRKPLWRKVVPVFLLVLLWLVPLGYLYAATSEGTSLVGVFVRKAVTVLLQHGVKFDRVVLATGIASVPLLLWLYWGFEKLIITTEGMERRLPFGVRRKLKWVDVDEVLIDHIDVIFEGKQTAKKVIKFYAVRLPFIPWRRHMHVTNREFECYHHAERIAAQVSIPAIAARKRDEIRKKGKPARFPIRDAGDGLLALIFLVGALALLPVWGLNRLWTPDIIQYRPYVLGVAVFLFLLSIRKFFFRQLGIDEKNLYVMRRDWITSTVPLDSIVDVRVLDNRLRIFAKKRRHKKPVQVFKSSRFVRNRGVLLRLIREAREEREQLDATPIRPVSSVRVPAVAPRPKPAPGPHTAPAATPPAETAPAATAASSSGDQQPSSSPQDDTPTGQPNSVTA